jgi:hypothetical protein
MEKTDAMAAMSETQTTAFLKRVTPTSFSSEPVLRSSGYGSRLILRLGA